MSKWLELARREFSTTPVRPTDNTDERRPNFLTSVTSVSHPGESEKSESSNVSKSSGEIREYYLPDELNPATLTRTMPDDPALRGKVHRLFDQADELDRAGDEAGALRILDDIRQTIQNATAATAPDKASRNGEAGKYGVAPVSTQPRASNAEFSRNPVAVQTSGNVPAMPPPGEREAVREVGPCGLCGGGRFWVSRWGVVNCMTCHPPADGKLIERNISIHV